MINPRTATTFGLMRQPHRNATRVQDNSGPPQGLAAPCRQAPDASNRLRPAVPSCYDRRRHLGGSPHVRHEATRVHHAARRRGGGVAARGARAAAGKLPVDRVLGSRARLRVRSHGPPLSCSAAANSAGSRAATSRSSIAGRRDDANVCRDRGRFRSASRSMSSLRRRTGGAGGQSRQLAIPIVFRRRRTRSARPRREPGATGRQRHRISSQFTGRWRQSGSNCCARFFPDCAGCDSGQCRQSRRPASVDEVQAAAARSALKFIRSNPANGGHRPAFAALKARADALYVVGDPLIEQPTGRINTLAWPRAADDVCDSVNLSWPEV